MDEIEPIPNSLRRIYLNLLPMAEKANLDDHELRLLADAAAGAFSYMYEDLRYPFTRAMITAFEETYCFEDVVNLFAGDLKNPDPLLRQISLVLHSTAQSELGRYLITQLFGPIGSDDLLTWDDESFKKIAPARVFNNEAAKQAFRDATMATLRQLSEGTMERRLKRSRRNAVVNSATVPTVPVPTPNNSPSDLPSLSLVEQIILKNNIIIYAEQTVTLSPQERIFFQTLLAAKNNRVSFQKLIAAGCTDVKQRKYKLKEKLEEKNLPFEIVDDAGGYKLRQKHA